ncbi:MAG: hypothetical protein K6T66_12905 [Peptococcaceae bacterium]|nr:hypothetical protein [Peptococcaceae bacterium]
MKVYLVAGAEMHESMLAVLEKNGFEMAGHEYTMDAAVVALKKKPVHPDLFIINGLAQASGAAGGVINRNRAMLLKLKEIRMAAPKSRILLLLPSENPPELIRNIISLGIYDIRQTSRFNELNLLDWINSPMSIADFHDFQTGQVPDVVQGEIRYSDDGFQPRKGLFSRIAGTIGEGGKDAVNGQAAAVPNRKRPGKPGAVLGVGDARIEDWIKENFSDQMDVLTASTDPEEIRRSIGELHPDICIIMRQSAIGGIPGAGDLAVWAAGRVPAVLFIAGELDGPGKQMVDRAAGAGVRHIISCEKGGFISGDELVYVLSGIIRELQDPGRPGNEKKDRVPFSGEARKTINSLLQGAGIFSRAPKAAETAPEKVPARARPRVVSKKARPRINMAEGLSLENKTPPEASVNSLKNPTAIVPGGILAVVTPWRPSLAGRLAAQAVRILSEVEGSEVAYVGASKNSTGAVWLNVSDEELMMSDWRVPGSSFPIERENIRIYAVDPAKDLPAGGETDLWDMVRQARKTATYTVLDFAGDMAAAGKAAHQGWAVVLAVLPGSDPVEYKTASLWFRNLAEGRQNVVAGIDLRGSPGGIPEGLRPKVVIRNNPADALASVLKKNNGDGFIWN